MLFASLESEFGKYRANPNLKYLKHNWTILLNDGFNKKIHILEIPANTFTQKDFYIRHDRNRIVLHIDKNFEDCHPQQGITNRFFEYKVQTIDYTDYDEDK